jgi:hypothetical protein
LCPSNEWEYGEQQCYQFLHCSCVSRV